jgi:hypothetical protein
MGLLSAMICSSILFHGEHVPGAVLTLVPPVILLVGFYLDYKRFLPKVQKFVGRKNMWKLWNSIEKIILNTSRKAGF